MRPLPWVSIKQMRELIQQHDDLDTTGIYVRWTGSPAADMRRGYSIDHSTGKRESGLSAQRLYNDHDDSTILSRTLEYCYLGGQAILYRGTEVGIDSDGAPTIADTVAVAKINTAQLRVDVARRKQVKT